MEPNSKTSVRTGTLIPAALLLVALGLIVLYTGRNAFLSPVALVVVAAIGFAALLLQIRLRPDTGMQSRNGMRASLPINVLGVIFALAAVFADVFRPEPRLALVTALAAVGCFAVSGVFLLNGLRKQRKSENPTV